MRVVQGQSDEKALCENCSIYAVKCYKSREMDIESILKDGGILPAILTVREAAVILRGSDKPENVKIVRRLLYQGAIRACPRPSGNCRGVVIFIPTSSIKEFAHADEFPVKIEAQIPSMLTIGETAEILRGSDTKINRSFVQRLLDRGSLKRSRGVRRQGAPVYITAMSVRDYAKDNPPLRRNWLASA